MLRVRCRPTGVWRKWLPSVSPGKSRLVATAAAKHASLRTSHILSLEPNRARRTIIFAAG